MTTNFDALLEAPARTSSEGRSLCKIGKVINDIPEPYKSAFLAQIELAWTDGGLTSMEVARKLRAAGFAAGETTVARHRRGDCVCEGV